MPKPVTVAPIVRLVVEDDLPALRELERNPENHVTDVRFEHAGTGESLYFLALRDDVPVGTAVLDLSESELLPELRNMFVYREARRTGVGGALAAFAELQARERGFEEIFLGVDPDNFEAIPLYLSLGYSPTGNHRVVETDNGDDGTHVIFHDAIYRKSLRVWS